MLQAMAWQHMNKTQRRVRSVIGPDPFVCIKS